MVYPFAFNNASSLAYKESAYCLGVIPADVPVVVLTIQGTERISKNYPWKSTKVRIKVVDVIPAERVKASKTAEIADEARALIEKDLEDNKF